MPTYRIVFSNGEKKTLVVEAQNIDYSKPGFVGLRADNNQRVVALIPTDKLLYIVDDKDATLEKEHNVLRQ